MFSLHLLWFLHLHPWRFPSCLWVCCQRSSSSLNVTLLFVGLMKTVTLILECYPLACGFAANGHPHRWMLPSCLWVCCQRSSSSLNVTLLFVGLMKTVTLILECYPLVCGSAANCKPRHFDRLVRSVSTFCHACSVSYPWDIWHLYLYLQLNLLRFVNAMVLPWKRQSLASRMDFRKIWLRSFFSFLGAPVLAKVLLQLCSCMGLC